jgi:predicted MFS family arabinose efflux permease
MTTALLLPEHRRLVPARAFWAMTAIMVTFTAASAAPSPLYVVYQQRWGFASSTLTEVFAVYALALLASLLVVGALSDHLGRRPVLAAAIVAEAVSVVLFLVASDVTTLAIARIVQGLATGAAVSTLGAALIDLQPAHAPGRGGVVNGVAPLAGLALGALGSGLLVQLAPAPTTLVWVVLLVMVAISAVAVALAPETSTLRPGARASLRPRIGLPAHLRPDVLSIVPVLVASWALGGLYMSLGPSVAASLLGVGSHLVGGLVVSALCGTGALSALVLRRRDTREVLVVAASFLVAGIAITLAGLDRELLSVTVAGTLVAGVGFGAAALGGFGTLARVAAPAERGEVFALAYVINYLAFSLPAVAAGFAATSVGLRSTTLVDGAAIMVVSLIALVGARASRRRPRVCTA